MVATDAFGNALGNSAADTLKDYAHPAWTVTETLGHAMDSGLASMGANPSLQVEDQVALAAASDKRQPIDDMVASLDGGVPSEIVIPGSRSLLYKDGNPNYVSKTSTDAQTTKNFANGYLTTDAQTGNSTFTNADMRQSAQRYRQRMRSMLANDSRN